MKKCWFRRMRNGWAAAVAAFVFPAVVSAAPPGPSNGLVIPGLTPGGTSVPWNIIVLLTILTLLPALLLAMTPFVRLLVVFHFLRQALGTQSTPTNQTLIGLALFLTYFIMQPVGADIYRVAIVPLQDNRISAMEALRPRLRPHAALHAEIRSAKRSGAVRGAGQGTSPEPPGRPFHARDHPRLHPFGAEGGIPNRNHPFFPFLVIDLVVASVTTSVGMMQLPPVVISTPLKILLFVMVDGWNLVVGSLMRSFY